MQAIAGMELLLVAPFLQAELVPFIKWNQRKMLIFFSSHLSKSQNFGSPQHSYSFISCPSSTPFHSFFPPTVCPPTYPTFPHHLPPSLYSVPLATVSKVPIPKGWRRGPVMSCMHNSTPVIHGLLSVPLCHCHLCLFLYRFLDSFSIFQSFFAPFSSPNC